MVIEEAFEKAFQEQLVFVILPLHVSAIAVEPFGN